MHGHGPERTISQRLTCATVVRGLHATRFRPWLAPNAGTHGTSRVRRQVPSTTQTSTAINSIKVQLRMRLGGSTARNASSAQRSPLAAHSASSARSIAGVTSRPSVRAIVRFRRGVVTEAPASKGARTPSGASLRHANRTRGTGALGLPRLREVRTQRSPRSGRAADGCGQSVRGTASSSPTQPTWSSCRRLRRSRAPASTRCCWF